MPSQFMRKGSSHHASHAVAGARLAKSIVLLVMPVVFFCSEDASCRANRRRKRRSRVSKNQVSYPATAW